LGVHIEDNLPYASRIQIKKAYMLSLKVSGMTCGGCINAVTRAVQSRDPQAKVQVDLASQTVKLETTLSEAQASQLMVEAGFPVSNLT
jgi:copper chaperone